jgi:hypothetical protein
VAAKRLTVELERVGKTATMFRVPFDLKEAFGRARPPVAITIRGHRWRTTPGVYDGAGHVVVSRAVYTHRREYVEWVEEAKRPETRARRVAGTIERVGEGRPRR